MVRVDFFATAVVALIVAIGLPALGASNESFTLSIGEFKSVTLPSTAEIRASRRGIVDVHHVDGDHWQLTAIGTGFVIIDAIDPESGETIEPRYHLTVERARRPSLTAKMPDWICATSGVTCSPSGTITGTTSDWRWYGRAFVACSVAKSCAFQVELTAAGIEVARRFIGNLLGQEFAVRMLEDGRLLVASPCDDAGKPRRLAETQARLGQYSTTKLVLIGCHAEQTDLSYRLSARLLLIEEATATRLGFSPSPAGGINLAPFTQGSSTSLSYASSLTALEQARDVEIVGSPVTRLLPDRSVEIVSGGEFQVIEPDKQGDGARSTWKQHGLVLKTRATPLANERMRLHVDGSLKFRADGQRSLTVSSLSTDVDVNLATPTLVGILDLATTEDSERHVPLLGRLPLIGPLFRLSGHDHSTNRLMIWMEVSKDDPNSALRSDTANRFDANP